MVFAIFLYRRGTDFSEVRSDRDLSCCPPAVVETGRRRNRVEDVWGTWPVLPPDFDDRDVYLNNTNYQKLHRKLSVKLRQKDQSESKIAYL